MYQYNMFDEMYETFKFDHDKEITVLETFAGIGSQRKALDRLSKEFNLNINYLAPVEFDKYAIASYNAIHGTNHDTKDITTTYGWEYKNVDILTWSFPCQSISLAGKREGLKSGSGTASSLGWEVIWILGEMEMYSSKPKILLMENVKNLLSEDFRKEFNNLQRHLEKLGYSNYYQVLNAKDYEVPQNRERVFMISILGEYSYSFPIKMPLKLRLKDLLEDEVDEKYYLSERAIKGILNSEFTQKKEQIQDKDGICSTILSRDYKDPKCVQVAQIYGTENEPNPQAGRVYDSKGLSPTLDSMQGGNRQPKILIPEATKKGYAEAQDGDGVYLDRPHQKRGCVQKGIIQTIKTSGNDVGVVVSAENDREIINPLKDKTKYGWHFEQNVYAEESPCIRSLKSSEGSGNKPKVINNLRIRKLTPLECIRLMDFEDEDYYKIKYTQDYLLVMIIINSNHSLEKKVEMISKYKVKQSDTQVYKQCGNSIVVNVLYHLIKQLF